MAEINAEMTLKEAIPWCSPAEQISLRPLAEMFGIRLSDFHIGHIETYETSRLTQVDRQVINAEVGTLLRLLERLGIGDDLRKSYRPLRDPVELSSEEREALPDRVLKYIQNLESDLRGCQAENNRIEGRLQRANYARWKK